MDFGLLEKLTDVQIQSEYDDILENNYSISVYCYWRVNCANGVRGNIGYTKDTGRTAGNCYPAHPGDEAERTICDPVNSYATYVCLLDKR